MYAHSAGSNYPGAGGGGTSCELVDVGAGGHVGGCYISYDSPLPLAGGLELQGAASRSP